ncbi:MAG: glycine C-acetyltransferase [Gammaproteobacteria bacterium]|nr:glycine C-acetyltransferase [Gammaproteobacteria bacterium]
MLTLSDISRLWRFQTAKTVRTASALIAVQAHERAALPLVGLSLRSRAGQIGQSLLLTQFLAPLRTRCGLSVLRLRFRSRAAASGQPQHLKLRDDALQIQADVIANAHAVRGLDALGIQMHFAAGDRSRGKTACFVKARMPQPFVQAGIRILIIGCHRLNDTSAWAAANRYNTAMQGNEFRERLVRDTAALDAAGLLKRERVIGSAQGPLVTLDDGREMINLCANNYLGLANHPAILQAAHDGLSRYGYGMASVRFICGTQSVHRDLEERLSSYLSMEDTILYSSCFDANGGLFETLLDEQDCVISDALNHASIIDGIRLCKARRLRYANNDLNELETHLKDSQNARVRMIATDGVFSMDGSIARLKEICDLAERYAALVMVDDSHATGFIGVRGRGTHEYRDVLGRVDILTSTLGKALGGASGGFVSARKEIVAWLRQRSRPYLFSNSIAPPVAAATIKVLDLLESSPQLRDKLHANARYFRDKMQALGFNLVPGEHPIIPVMLGEAPLAVQLAERMQTAGIYVVAFSFPVVPHGKARIRTQMNAAHSFEQLDQVISAFGRSARELGIIH